MLQQSPIYLVDCAVMFFFLCFFNSVCKIYGLQGMLNFGS